MIVRSVTGVHHSVLVGRFGASRSLNTVRTSRPKKRAHSINNYFCNCEFPHRGTCKGSVDMACVVDETRTCPDDFNCCQVPIG